MKIILEFKKKVLLFITPKEGKLDSCSFVIKFVLLGVKYYKFSLETQLYSFIELNTNILRLLKVVI